MRGEQCLGGVQDSDAGTREELELPEPGLDAVERAAHVEPPNGDVAGLEAQHGLGRRRHCHAPAPPARGGQAEIRPGGAVGDQRDLHPVAVWAGAKRPWGTGW